jgi:hypothetical protein
MNKCLPLTLLVLSGLTLLYHQTYYQPALATGDHGRDLYAAVATLRGDLPYRDYWWVYGPLMPYFDAGTIKVLGTTVHSFLWGRLFWHILGGVFFYLTLSLHVPAIWAWIGTLWFWLFMPDFFFTYNHVGGIAMVMLVTYGVCAYVATRHTISLHFALVGILLLCLIKINFGIAALVLVILSVPAIDRGRPSRIVPNGPRGKHIFWISALVTLPAIVLLVYGVLLYDLPAHVVRQCLPYLSGDQPYHVSLVQALQLWTQMIVLTLQASWVDAGFALLVLGCALRLGHLAITHRLPRRNGLVLTLAWLGVYFGVNMHEFWVSGVIYRGFWAQPLSILITMLIIGAAMQTLPRTVKTLAFTAILCIVLVRFIDQLLVVETRHPSQYLALERGQVLTGNSPEWINTVEEATTFLTTHLKTEELFFALPYDPLYYYLTDKRTPTRQLIFFDHINIPPEQERQVIAELKANNVEYVLLSSRMNSRELGLGVFGQTYCPLIARYIGKNFEEIAIFGDWQNPPGWSWNHGVKILRRKAMCCVDDGGREDGRS